MPVEAPEGVMARNMPLWVYTSASTVGLPRESKIWRPTTLVMAAGVCFFRYSDCDTTREEDGEKGKREAESEERVNRVFFFYHLSSTLRWRSTKDPTAEG